MAIVTAPVLPTMAVSAPHTGLSRPLRADCRISSLVMDPGCPFPRNLVNHRLDRDVAASEDGCSYPALRKYGIQPSYCTRRWPYESSNFCVSFSHKAVFRLDPQRRQNIATSPVCP